MSEPSAGGQGIEIVCVGECMLELSGPREALMLSCAGDTYNTAVYLSRLLPGARVRYATRLGGDGHSGMMVGEMEREGVDTTLVARVAGRLPGLYTITLDGGERHFHYWRSEAPVRQMLSGVEPELQGALEAASCLYATGITLAVLGQNATPTGSATRSITGRRSGRQTRPGSGTSGRRGRRGSCSPPTTT